MDVRQGERVLDVSSGSGLVALHSARRGAKVTAADSLPEALLCINRSFILAGFGLPDVRDLALDDVALDETFDAITWTPPFLSGDDSDPVRRRQFRGDGSRIRAFLKHVPNLLGRGGRLLFPYPDHDAAGWLHDALDDAGLRWAALVHRHYSVIGAVRLYRAWAPIDGETSGEVVAGSSLPGAAWVLQDR
jgi:methylase of polypeptide subunit release factors